MSFIKRNLVTGSSAPMDFRTSNVGIHKHNCNHLPYFRSVQNVAYSSLELEASMMREIMVSRLIRNAVLPQIMSTPFALRVDSALAGQSSVLTSQSPSPVRVVSPTVSPPETRGLDLLSSASSIITDNSEKSSLSIPRLENVPSNESNIKSKGKKGRFYIEDDIRINDILCGRGGRSNNHPGNKRYRYVVNDMRTMYQKTEAKTVKTDLSCAIVEHCCSYGARFLKLDNTSGQYFVLTKAEARKKTSQALRETKDLKWTA